MAQNSIDVRDVAKLARLDLTEEEIDRFQAQLGSILEHIEQLSQVDVSGIEPTANATSVSNRVRPDEPTASLPPEGLLQNAPDQGNGQLRVPKVVDA